MNNHKLIKEFDSLVHEARAFIRSISRYEKNTLNSAQNNLNLTEDEFVEYNKILKKNVNK